MCFYFYDTYLQIWCRNDETQYEIDHLKLSELRCLLDIYLLSSPIGLTNLPLKGSKWWSVMGREYLFDLETPSNFMNNESINFMYL